MAKPNNIKNLLSETEGLAYLKRIDRAFITPSLNQKKFLLSLIGLPKFSTRSFDLVKLKVNSFEEIEPKNDFLLVEVKVTKNISLTFPKDSSLVWPKMKITYLNN